MKIKEIVSALERFAPLPLQEGYDNAGLQVGLTEAEATGALLCLDVTEAVIDEAISLGFNLIVAHHPLLFKGLKSITGSTYVERCLLKAIKNDIAIYAAHTNLDNAPQGVSFMMARKLGLTNVRVLEPQEGSLLKFSVYVPVDYADAVRDALFAAGCGHTGLYDQCSYRTEGLSTFRPKDGAHPYIGKDGEMHQGREVKIETILPACRRRSALAAMYAAHPYEEPAFDLIPLQNVWTQAGAGVIGELEQEETELDFLYRLKKTFECACVRHNKLRGREIRRVALCGGAGASLMSQALRQQADVFVTGEIKYHDFFGHERDMLLAEIGHYESEQYTKDILYTIIHDSCPSLDIALTKIDTNPIKYL